METKLILELAGYAIAVLLAIIGFAQSKDNWKDKASIASAALCLVILTILLSVRYDIIPRIEENQQLANTINENPKAFSIAEEYIEANNFVESTNNILFKEALNDRYKQFSSHLELATNGQFIISKEDLGAFSYKLIEKTENTIIATSYVDSEEFWDNPSGEKYEELNYRLAREGKNITRYFIFSNQQEYKKALSRLDTQSKNKINVFVAFVNQLGRQETDDVIIVDDIIGGRLKLTPDKGISHAVMYTEDDDLEEIYKIVDNLRAKAKRHISTK